jgi:DNA-binding GntR family transcriptional regulator
MARPHAAEEQGEPAPPSRLQSDLAARILRKLQAEGAGSGYHLVELDLCREFGVSRTPIRGALKLLAQQGKVESRANRGYVLIRPVKAAPEVDPIDPREEEDQKLFVAIAKARNTGVLPDESTQLEMLRLFDTKLATLIRVLRQLAEIGLVERKPGNGWSFLPSIDSARAQAESYAFRRVVEPAGLAEATFELNRDWMERSRAQHLAFRKLRWRDTLAVEFYQMNSDFHEQLARCSGNRYLLGAVQRQNQLRSFLNYHWVHGVERVIESIEEHLAIFDALDTGDRETAQLLMKAHLTSSSEAYTPPDGDVSIPGPIA